MRQARSLRPQAVSRCAPRATRTMQVGAAQWFSLAARQSTPASALAPRMRAAAHAQVVVRRALSTEAGAVTVCEDEEEYNEAVAGAGSKLVVSYFTAAWCGPCKMIWPVVQKLAKEHSDDAVFLKIDVDDNSDTAMANDVRMMPTFIFLKDGAKVHDFAGADPAKLTAAVDRLL